MRREPVAMFLVLRSRGNWWVDFEGKGSGPFISRDAAAREAAEMAQVATASGRKVEIRIPDDNGRYIVAWTNVQKAAAA